MKPKNRRILVTGAAGFIGSHLVDALIEDNYVKGYDNLSSGKKEFLDHLANEDNFELVEEDVLDEEALYREMEGFDLVFHLAANPDVRVGAVDTYTHLEQNILATYRVLEVMRRHGLRDIVFTSTSTVYGETDIIPTPEDMGPLKPISLYGSSKLGCEALISAYCSTFDMRGISFRFANVVGPRSTHGVTYDFVNKLRRNPEELEILGSPPGTTKSYFYITDCIDGMLFAVENARDRVEYFNIGSKDHTDVKAIADIVCREMGLEDVEYSWTGGVDGGRGWKGDVKIMLLSLDKLESLGWSPEYKSGEAIALTVRSLLDEGR